MVVYTVKAYTGDRIFAGSINYIYIRIYGSEADSEEHQMNISLFGSYITSEQKIKIKCESTLGALAYIQIRSEKFVFDDKWFCKKIIIETPEGDDILFPCYNWFGDNGNGDNAPKIFPAKATLVQQHTGADNTLRANQLKKQRRIYSWSENADGIPEGIQYENAADLPAELQFSFTKQMEFYYTAATEMGAIMLNGQVDDASWESFDDLRQTVSGNKTLEYVKKHWDKDEFFGHQFLNGLNPMMIKKCSKPQDNFPVTEEMVKGLLGGSTLQKEMERGNIFLVDYKMLADLKGNEIHGKKHYLAAPLVLLYSNPKDKKLLPIAIQLNKEPGEERKGRKEENPIFLPSDSESDWTLAKIFVRAAEFSVHEVDFHLLRTHLLAEVFTVATLRNLPRPHPLYKLLFPHIRYTLQINIMARNKLISEDGVISTYSGVGGDSLPMLLKRATAALTYSSLCLPDNIAERGLETVPNYYYRDDGLELWDIINKYVGGYLKYYYGSVDESVNENVEKDTEKKKTQSVNENVKKDTELANWIKEIHTHGFLGKETSGIPSSFETLAELVKFVTMVIFTASGQHAAVNNGQYEFGGWMPNYPTALRKPPPTVKGQTTECIIFETLPDKGTTSNGIAVLKLLSTKSTDRYRLGYFPEALCDEEEPVQITKDFRKHLRELSANIEKRNKKLELPYTYLNPKNVDNSVAL